MGGSMEAWDGTTIKRFEQKQADQFTVGELLLAANVSLEDTSDAKAGQTDSLRCRGAELLVKIDYRNRGGGWALRPPTYKITVRRIPFAEYKITESDTPTQMMSQQGDMPAERTLLNRFGVKIHFVQTGRIARFSWNALILEFVAGLTLLSVAQLVVDNIAFYVHPHSDKIEKIVYEKVGWEYEADLNAYVEATRKALPAAASHGGATTQALSPGMSKKEK